MAAPGSPGVASDAGAEDGTNGQEEAEEEEEEEEEELLQHVELNFAGGELGDDDLDIDGEACEHDTLDTGVEEVDGQGYMKAEDKKTEVAKEMQIKLTPYDMATLCLLCGLHPRKAKAIFCQFGCEADVRGAARDATSQGPHAKKAFGTIQRAGGPAFCEAIRLYKSKCQGSGRGYRRPRFAWVKYQMLLETKSEMQWGSKPVSVTKSSFLRQLADAAFRC